MGGATSEGVRKQLHSRKQDWVGVVIQCGVRHVGGGVREGVGEDSLEKRGG